MGKKDRKPPVVNNIHELNLEIDYDKLAEAIVKARQIETKNEQDKKEAELKEWRKSIGIKDYDEKKGLIKRVLLFLNHFWVFIKLLFYPKKKKMQVSMVNAVMQSVTAVFFHAIKFVLWVLSSMFIVVCFFHGNMMFSFINYFFYFSCALMSFMLASIFRLMAIETEQITERERVLGIFTAVMSVTPMIEIIVAFFKEVI
jgi:hypothetical protein